jgi:hypothetical protein
MNALLCLESRQVVLSATSQICQILPSAPATNILITDWLLTDAVSNANVISYFVK